MQQTVIFTMAAFLASLSLTQAFSPARTSITFASETFSRSKAQSTHIMAKAFSDFPPEDDDEYSGDIDWDAEWKKVVTNKDQPNERPGKYKTDLEIAATKAKLAAEKKLISVKNESKNMTNWNSLKGDWKVCVLLIIHEVFLPSPL